MPKLALLKWFTFTAYPEIQISQLINTLLSLNSKLTVLAEGGCFFANTAAGKKTVGQIGAET